MSVCQQGYQDTGSGHLCQGIILTGSQIAWDVEWEHLSPRAWCRDGMGSLMVVPGLHGDSSALLSISSASPGSVCAGAGAVRVWHPSLMATAHFHLIEKFQSQFASSLPQCDSRPKFPVFFPMQRQMLSGLGDCSAFGGAAARPRGELGARTRVLYSSAGLHGISARETAALAGARPAALRGSCPALEQRRPRGGRAVSAEGSGADTGRCAPDTA